MLTPSENEWTIIEPTSITTTQADNMATINDTTLAPAAEPKIELAINAKSKLDSTITPVDEKKATACTCDSSMPKLERQNSIESFISIDEDYRHNIRPIRPYIRDYSPVRPRRHDRVYSPVPLFEKSTQLLDSVGKLDTTVDLPSPSRGSVYITTFPFTDKDVKKWAWLFSVNVEETFLEESKRGRSGRDADINDDNDDFGRSTVRRARNISPYYNPGSIDIPSVYLSRALDTEVVPEGTADVSYLIVTQNRHRPAGSKLLIAESRKAAGIIMYYEALKGDSIMFVGGVVGFGDKKVHPKKFKKVDTLEEAIKLKEEGLVGVLC